MKRTLVAYFSRTGNTKIIAEAIYDALEGEKDIFRIGEVPGLDSYDLVFVGFPIQSHSVPYKAETFLKSIPAGKKIALFCTHGALPGHRISREALEYAAVLAARTKILGTFAARGKLSLQAIEILSRSPEHQEWTEMAPSANTHPDAGDVEEAKAFARLIKIRSDHGQF